MIDIQVGGGEGARAPAGAEVLVERAVAHVLRAERVEAAEISVALLGDAEIAELNRSHLGHDYPADVISFPLDAVGGRIVGDIYIGAEQAARQASEHGVPVEEELQRLAIHGTLHVLGFDHPDEEEVRATSEMYALQERLLRDLRDGAASGD